MSLTSSVDDSNSQTSDEAKFSGFLELPGEVRNLVYSYAFIPKTVRVSSTGPGDELLELYRSPSVYFERKSVPDRKRQRQPSRVRLEYFHETAVGLEILPLSISRFVVNRQIYTEILSIFFGRCVWTFGNTKCLLDALEVLSLSVKRQIRNLAISVESQGRTVVDIHGGSQWIRTACSFQRHEEATVHFRNLGELETLYIYIDVGLFSRQLDKMLKLHKTRSRSRKLEYEYSAFEVIALYSWGAKVIKIPIAKSELPSMRSQGWLDQLEHFFGAENVRWIANGEDRYQRVLGDIVIHTKRRHELDVGLHQLASPLIGFNIVGKLRGSGQNDTVASHLT